MEQLGASGGESIKVFVRVRPPDPKLESEVGRGDVCLDASSETSLTVYSKPEPKIFTFDHVADKNTTQEDVFSAVGRPIIDSCMRGYNGTIFAYGQTGSGKTFTMIGPPSEDSADTFTHELRGIIPRSFEYLFTFINRNKQKYGELVEFLCKCSFLEIYNEQVFDLLDPASSGLHLRENMKHGVYVDGLTEISVMSAKESYQVLSTGWVNRKVASTSMNRESSRSHAVFTLSIESKKREAKDDVAKIRTSVLNLVDLAGSERQRDTRAAGLRLKEAGSINKSLSALGNVIMALVDIANGKSRHVHYRDSKLTFLLRDSLGGNAKTNLVANVHPSARCFGESLSTLNFARRAKMIRNKAVVNEDASGNVLQLQAEIKRLRTFLEKYKAGAPQNAVLLSPSFPGSPPETKPEDGKAYQELKGMLSSSMEARDQANTERKQLSDQVERLRELCDKKDKFLQSTKMILKFREAHISNLEKTQKLNSSEQGSTSEKLLHDEIKQLKYLVDHHPESSRLARENIDLRAEIKKLRASGDTSRQLTHSHQYTLQLEKQLRYYLAKGGSNGTSSSSLTRLAPNMPIKATFDLEGLQVRCKHLQEELNSTRRAWNGEKEEFHLRESKLEANLSSSRKANVELERSIEALKLKNSVEKSTLNDIHMATIKTILTPKRDRDHQVRNRSYSCTPSTLIHRADSEPLQHQLSFSTGGSSTSKTGGGGGSGGGGGATELLSPLPERFPVILESPYSTPTPHPKKPRLSRSPAISSSESNGIKEEGFAENDDSDRSILEDSLDEGGARVTEEGEELDDSNIQDALTDELKILQDKNQDLQHQLEELERRVVHLTHAKKALEAQVEEITQLSRIEREGYYEKEQSYLKKISDMALQLADLKSTSEVFESEVHDLRVCLKSADRELKELKEERIEDSNSHNSKVMGYVQKIGELEQACSSEEYKYNRAMEELQNIQDETETLREELTFKDHRILELEAGIKKEKVLVSAGEGEVQTLLDKLAMEVERNTRLSVELQEGHTGNEELLATVNENTRLHNELEQFESDLQTHLQSHKQQMEEAEGTINTLLREKATDEAAIAGFVATLHELRQEKALGASRIVSLTRECEDSGKELEAAVSRNEELRSQVENLHQKMSEDASVYSRELAKKEAEREIVFDDLESLNDQYQQLNMAFESQARKLATAQNDLEIAKSELKGSENALNRILEKKIERRASTNESNDWMMVETSSELKRKLDQAAEMIESYEQSREEKNRELQNMKEQLLSYEEMKTEFNAQQIILTELHYELNYVKDREAESSSLLQAARSAAEKVEEERMLLVNERKMMMAQSGEMSAQCDSLKEQMSCLNDQIERYKNSEESLFQEKENIRSQLEMTYEERAKLSKECEKLVKENAAISGHQNIRQRIQYHATVKVENAKLKEEVIQLHSRLRRKADQVEKLQHILTEKGLDLGSNKTSNGPKKRTQSELQSRDIKENVTPVP